MSLKILVADDEPNIVISLEYLLKREGYTVRVARDGQEGGRISVRVPVQSPSFHGSSQSASSSVTVIPRSTAARRLRPPA